MILLAKFWFSYLNRFLIFNLEAILFKFKHKIFIWLQKCDEKWNFILNIWYKITYFNKLSLWNNTSTFNHFHLCFLRLRIIVNINLLNYSFLCAKVGWFDARLIRECWYHRKNVLNSLILINRATIITWYCRFYYCHLRSLFYMIIKQLYKWHYNLNTLSSRSLRIGTKSST